MDNPQYRIGGSEAAILLGISTFGTPLTLYLEKKGLRARANLDDKEYVKAGKFMEDAVARWYADETGRDVIVPGSESDDIGASLPAIFLGMDPLGAGYAHKDRPWMQAHPDRFTRRDGVPGIIEAKNANFMKRDDWSDEPPLPYQVQLAHTCEVMGASFGSLAAIIGGSAFRWADAERNAGFIAMLIEKEEAFIRRLENDEPPDPIGDEKDRKALADLFGREVDQSIMLPPEVVELDERLANAVAKKKEAEEEETLCKNLIMQMMGTASIGVIPGGRGSFSWKTQERKGYVVEPSSARVFRRLKK